MARRFTFVIFLIFALLLQFECAFGAYVESFDCFDDRPDDGSRLRFSSYTFSALMSDEAGFPLHISLYGVFNNASTSDDNSTKQYPVHPRATVSISTLGFSLLKFNASTDEIANGRPIFTLPDSARADRLSVRPPVLNFTRNLGGDLTFTTLSAVIKFYSEDDPNLSIGCIRGSFTPNIGSEPYTAFRYLPLVILMIVGLAAALTSYTEAAWNGDRKLPLDGGAQQSAQPQTLLGIGDCLQYIQFIMLSGCLTMNLPGYYQPIISSVSWSTLLFNSSFIGEPRFNTIQDGIYQTNGTGGIQTMSQAIGNLSTQNLWFNMLIGLLCIIGGLVALVQFAYFVRWSYRALMVNHISANLGEPSPAQKFHYTFWNVIKLVFSYFLLPIVAFSLYMIFISRLMPLYNTYIAIAIVVILTVCLGVLVWHVWRHKSSSFLIENSRNSIRSKTRFGSLRTRLAPHFGIIPILLTWLRGVAMGGLQQSGTAQLGILISCEIIYITALSYFRPYPSLLSSHACLSFCRLVNLSLAIGFLPKVDASIATRGWLGYIILSIHAGALVLGFLFKALATLWITTTKLVRKRREAKALDERGRRGTFRVYGNRQLFQRSGRTDDFSRPTTPPFRHLEETRSGRPNTLLRLESFGDRIRSNKSVEELHDNGSSRSKSSPPVLLRDSCATLISAESHLGQERPFPLPTRSYHRLPRTTRYVSETTDSDTYSQHLVSESYEGYDHERSAADGEEGASLRVSLNNSPADYTIREADLFYGARQSMTEDPFKDPPRQPLKAGGTFKAAILGWFVKEKPKAKGFEVVRARRPPPQLLIPAGHSLGESSITKYSPPSDSMKGFSEPSITSRSS